MVDAAHPLQQLLAEITHAEEIHARERQLQAPARRHHPRHPPQERHHLAQGPRLHHLQPLPLRLHRQPSAHNQPTHNGSCPSSEPWVETSTSSRRSLRRGCSPPTCLSRSSRPPSLPSAAGSCTSAASPKTPSCQGGTSTTRWAKGLLSPSTMHSACFAKGSPHSGPSGTIISGTGKKAWRGRKR
ncbi:hypothetical protein VPH35_032483 [Triticum aestivum]